MNVFLVISGERSDYTLLGIFTTRKAAEDLIAKMQASAQQDHDDINDFFPLLRIEVWAINDWTRAVEQMKDRGQFTLSKDE